ncbi:MAG: transposase [Candidatus Aegiribacteria sp.]|nr:transposase [Candidatus Aegiribacteria sp.]
MRPLRIKFPGALYHIYARGNGCQPIYLDEEDRHKFSVIFQKILNRFGWNCYALCLMNTHYHLFIETPETNLSMGMQNLNGIYAQYFNKHHDLVGHVFQGRYNAIVVDRENYFLELCRYIVLNPVRAGIVEKPEEYSWSSYRQMVGIDESMPFIKTDFLLEHFGSSSETAKRNFRKFVLDGISSDSPLEDTRGGLILGKDEFVESLRDIMIDSKNESEFTKYQRYSNRPLLEKLFPSGVRSVKEARDKAIYKAYIEYGYSQKEIADFLKLHFATVSRIIKNE